MPYIICVNQPGCLPEQDPYAVATIEDAREAAWEECKRTSGPNTATVSMRAFCEALPETGGVIGPLPDGYVIDVRLVKWEELLSLCPPRTIERTPGDGGQPILDAYNAER